MIIHFVSVRKDFSIRPPASIPTFFFFNDTATTEIYTLSLHDALPIWTHLGVQTGDLRPSPGAGPGEGRRRSEEHTSELQSLTNLVCRLLLEKKKKETNRETISSKCHTTLQHKV